MSLSRFSVLLSVLLVCTSSFTVQAQSSVTILPGSDPIWQSLNQSALTLPNSYDLFMASLTGQVNSLQDRNQSLTLKNEDLQNSLRISQEAVATSENKSTLLQKALDTSTASTIQAQADAKSLELSLNFWRATGILGGSVGIIAVILAVLK